jgi:hypothetical protein
VPLTELPFGLPGRIFRSPMPFGPYDLHGEVYDRFCEEQIAVIVLLASDEECLHKTGCNLRALYLKEGFQVLYLPIPDFGVPTRDDLEQAVRATLECGVKKGAKVAETLVPTQILWSNEYYGEG